MSAILSPPRLAVVLAPAIDHVTDLPLDWTSRLDPG